MTFPARDTIATYGGVLVDLFPVTDPTTDRPASGANQAYGSAAALTKTGVKAWVRMTTAGSNPPTLAATGMAHDAAWGNALSYAPTFSRTSTGIFVVTWPTTVNDEVGALYSVNFRAVLAPCAEGSTPFHAQGEIASPNQLTIRIFALATGAPTDATGSSGTTFLIGAI